MSLLAQPQRSKHGRQAQNKEGHQSRRFPRRSAYTWGRCRAAAACSTRDVIRVNRKQTILAAVNYEKNLVFSFKTKTVMVSKVVITSTISYNNQSWKNSPAVYSESSRGDACTTCVRGPRSFNLLRRQQGQEGSEWGGVGCGGTGKKDVRFQPETMPTHSSDFKRACNENTVKTPRIKKLRCQTLMRNCFTYVVFHSVSKPN